MSDFRILTEMLERSGIVFTAEDNLAGDKHVTVTAIDRGVHGYQGFYAQFMFAANGRLVSITVAE